MVLIRTLAAFPAVPYHAASMSTPARSGRRSLGGGTMSTKRSSLLGKENTMSPKAAIRRKVAGRKSLGVMPQPAASNSLGVAGETERLEARQKAIARVKSMKLKLEKQREKTERAEAAKVAAKWKKRDERMAQFRAKYGTKLKKLDEQKQSEELAQSQAAKAAEAVAAGSITTNVRVTRRTAQSSGAEAEAEVPGAPANVNAAMDFGAMKYKELQAECKRQGLSAGGKTEVLVARLQAAAAAAAVEADGEPLGETRQLTAQEEAAETERLCCYILEHGEDDDAAAVALLSAVKPKKLAAEQDEADGSASGSVKLTAFDHEAIDTLLGVQFTSPDATSRKTRAVHTVHPLVNANANANVRTPDESGAKTSDDLDATIAGENAGSSATDVAATLSWEACESPNVMAVGDDGLRGLLAMVGDSSSQSLDASEGESQEEAPAVAAPAEPAAVESVAVEPVAVEPVAVEPAAARSPPQRTMRHLLAIWLSVVLTMATVLALLGTFGMVTFDAYAMAQAADEAAARAGLAWGMAVEWAHLLCKMDWYEGLAERATEWVTTTHDRILLQMVGL